MRCEAPGGPVLAAALRRAVDAGGDLEVRLNGPSVPFPASEKRQPRPVSRVALKGSVCRWFLVLLKGLFKREKGVCLSVFFELVPPVFWVV